MHGFKYHFSSVCVVSDLGNMAVGWKTTGSEVVMVCVPLTARVFPEPVWAMPTMSWPLRATGKP